MDAVRSTNHGELKLHSTTEAMRLKMIDWTKQGSEKIAWTVDIGLAFNKVHELCHGNFHPCLERMKGSVRLRWLWTLRSPMLEDKSEAGSVRINSLESCRFFPMSAWGWQWVLYKMIHSPTIQFSGHWKHTPPFLNHCAFKQSPQHEYLRAAAPDGGAIPIIVSSRLFSDATVKPEQIKHDSNVLTVFKACHNEKPPWQRTDFFPQGHRRNFERMSPIYPKVSLTWWKFLFSAKRVIKVIYDIHTGSIEENTYNGRDNERQ